MDTIRDNGLAEKATAEEVIAATPPLPEVDSINVRLYEDWTGDPSLYITFRMKPGIEVDDAFIKRFVSYSGKLQLRIIDTGISRFPYVSLQGAA